MADQHGELEMKIEAIEIGSPRDSYLPVQIDTSRGAVLSRYYRVPGARRGAIWIGGVGGGWDTPANDLYPRLCVSLQSERIASLRIRFRQPTELLESVLDVLAGLSFLQSEGIQSAALIGHSFGGAVVIQCAALMPVVRSVVTLATQSYGAEPAADLPAACALLLIHGVADHILPADCSQYVHHIAREPKRLILYEGAGHMLAEVADEVYHEVRDWITGTL